MATADLLLELMFSWIDQRECCARQLKKLANELESLREKCNASECIGNSVSVVGAACLLGAGAATLFTGGAAAPFLGLLGGVCTGVGVTVSVATKLTEHFVSSDTMKEAEKIEEKSNNIAQRIQKLFDQLKAEIKKVSPSADLDEVDRSVMTKLLGAMARRSALEMKIDFSKLHDMLHRSSHKDMNMQLNPSSLNTMTIVLAGILTFFAFQNSGKGFKLLIAEATKRLIKQMSITGVKTAFKGGAMVVGGAVGLAFALPEAVDNWKEAIKNNHVTEASQSLKDTADAILKMTRELREKFDNMRKMLVDVAEQQEQERIEMVRRQREQERIEMVRRQREQERNEMARRQRKQERIEMARRQREQERIEMVRRQREQERNEMARRQREQERIEMARRQREQERIEMVRRQREQERNEMARRQRKQERIEMARRQREQERIEMVRRQREQERNEMARRQQEQERIEMVRRQREQERIEMARRQREQERIEMARHQKEQERIEKAEHQKEQERTEKAERQKEQERTEKAERQKEQEQQNKQTGSEPQRGDDQGDKERDQKDDESDQEDEESDQEDKESDQEDKESDQENEEHQQADDLPNITTFEYVARVLQHDTWNEPILFINVYRPPKYLTRAKLRAFLKEFQSLLDHYRNYNNVIVAGDFNIWVDTPEFIPSRFLEFLQNNNLVQHVNEPTHKKHHILDLVMSRNVDISDLSVQNDRISDHFTISFKAKPKDQEGKAVKVGLLNCRSVNNKPEMIFDLIERNNLDIFLLTETWSKDNTAFKVFTEASPEGFSFIYKSRKERRGGGVAILIRKELLKEINEMKSKKQDQDESVKRFKENEE